MWSFEICTLLGLSVLTFWDNRSVPSSRVKQSKKNSSQIASPLTMGSLKSCNVELYFRCEVGDQGKAWAPSISCVIRITLLNGWKNGSHHTSFIVPMVWKGPEDHSSDCHFHWTDTPGITSSQNTGWYNWNYHQHRDLFHSEELPVQKPPYNVTLDKDDSDQSRANEKFCQGDGWRWCGISALNA
jgi:hypothetical protein